MTKVRAFCTALSAKHAFGRCVYYRIFGQKMLARYRKKFAQKSKYVKINHSHLACTVMTPNTLATVLRVADRYNEDCPTAIKNLICAVIKPPLSVDVLTEHTAVSFILSGMQTMTMGQKRHQLQAGQVYFIPFKLPVKTEFCFDKRPQFVAVSLVLDPDWLSDILHKTPSKPILPPVIDSVATADTTPACQDCLTRLINLLDTPTPHQALAELYKQELILHLLDTPLSAQLTAFASQDSHLSKIKKVSDHLHEHWAEKITIAELAQIAQMGESSFFHYFKAYTGLTPLQYQKTLRLNHARQCLLNGMPVSQSAYTAGFESLSQFSREYKRAFGKNPSDEK